ncbi:hypothetical protein BGW36DRAFT_362633 [Talaromyces proteolyticus]|uniref:Uncharacterized protein n=1 Tax=Talaromyces proteolyticus TaxID=1131652 RepID=A0AAD4KPH7_9EURO|nr:uncharacterized protein BGW36DRAFT_362633 [Talaromyces proteolyticus]KAH8693096.1 hypothetical protein BGW36DRAFT_362633 [Talaromyces proteolyticus]
MGSPTGCTAVETWRGQLSPLNVMRGNYASLAPKAVLMSAFIARQAFTESKCHGPVRCWEGAVGNAAGAADLNGCEPDFAVVAALKEKTRTASLQTTCPPELSPIITLTACYLSIIGAAIDGGWLSYCSIACPLHRYS